VRYLGYVNYHTGTTGVLRGVFSPRHTLGTQDGNRVSRGDIHRDRDTLSDADMRVRTFIHEASHKYASTADHGESGYLNDSFTAFKETGMTTDQALNNADSYACFCLIVATAKRS
jgi:hypothetical protein